MANRNRIKELTDCLKKYPNGLTENEIILLTENYRRGYCRPHIYKFWQRTGIGYDRWCNTKIVSETLRRLVRQYVIVRRLEQMPNNKIYYVYTLLKEQIKQAIVPMAGIKVKKQHVNIDTQNLTFSLAIDMTKFSTMVIEGNCHTDGTKNVTKIVIS